MIFVRSNHPAARFYDKISRLPQRHAIGLTLVCIVFLAFGLNHLGQFMTVDEEKWLYVRVRQLYTAIVHFDWRHTYINDKPGILPSLLAGIVQNFTSYKRYNPGNIETFLFFWRLPIVLFNFLLIPVIYHFGAKLLGKTESLFVTAAIACNPVTIGISQIVNPDATLWSTCSVSALNFLLFLKNSRIRHMVLSGVFLGLALVSKFSANYFILGYFPVLYIAYISGWMPRKRYAAALVGWVGTVVFAVLVYYLMFPATWDNYPLLLRGTLGSDLIVPVIVPFSIAAVLLSAEVIGLKGRFSRYLIPVIGGRILVVLGIGLTALIVAVIVGSLVNEDFWGSLPRAYRGGGAVLPNLVSNVFVLSTTLNTVVVFGIFVLGARCFVSFWRPLPTRNACSRRYMMMLFVLGAGYLCGISLTGYYAAARYQAISYPFYSAVAALALMMLTRRRGVLFVFMMAALMADLYYVSPFYLTFNNPLNFRKVYISDGWGYGGYEIAEWLNARYCKKNTKVWYDREGFSQFSKCRNYRWNKRPWEIPGLDYLVLSSRGATWAKDARHHDSGRYVYGPLLEYYSEPAELEIQFSGNPNSWIRLVRYDRTELERVARMRARLADGGLGYLNLNAPFSVSFWVKTSAEVPMAPFEIEGGYERSVAIESRKDIGKGGFRLRYAAVGKNSVVYTGPINDGKWHLIVWYHAGGKVGDEYGVFVDGKKTASAKVPLLKKKTPVVKQRTFKGEMDEFEIHREILSDGEILEMYTAGLEEHEEDDEDTGDIDKEDKRPKGE